VEEGSQILAQKITSRQVLGNKGFEGCFCLLQKYYGDKNTTLLRLKVWYKVWYEIVGRENNTSYLT
jgi:hypothetical protein